MAKANKGHVIELVYYGARKHERCKVCEDEKKRGQGWRRPCPGPRQPPKMGYFG